MVTKSNPIYLDFYTKYIASKVLTPRTYNLTFEGLSYDVNGQKILISVNGTWGTQGLISLAPDRYIVHGSSSPTQYTLAGDTCYLGFNDTINVTESETHYTVKAIYDCSLILVDTTGIDHTFMMASPSTWMDHGPAGAPIPYTYTSTMMKTDGFYHTFLKSRYVAPGRVELDLVITKRDKKQVPIYLWTYKWEEGKYYYFGNTDNTYNLVPMTNSDILLPANNNH
jgi:hypothetical protein